ncbi:hypothetical protein C8R46DRAFT_1075563 [Mycena filopes]|nr:hypothetical protein C8R46DRAFT_1075563 [Mycena filopes]
MPIPSSPVIPQELCDEVLACVPVKNDPDKDVEDQDRYFTLRQCALVCKAWLPKARSHILRTVYLSSDDECERLLELLKLNSMLSQYMSRSSLVLVIRTLRWSSSPNLHRNWQRSNASSYGSMCGCTSVTHSRKNSSTSRALYALSSESKSQHWPPYISSVVMTRSPWKGSTFAVSFLQLRSSPWFWK